MINYLKALLYPLVVQWRLFKSRNNPQEIFTAIYQRNAWGSRESVSGCGSTLQATAVIRQELPRIIDQYKISSITDIPCGDFNWMRAVELGNVSYTGGDIVNALILKNRKRYADDNRQFIHINLLTDKLPKADLFLCRDCLGHLSDRDVGQAVMNIKRSGALYLLATVFPEAKNTTILTGDFRLINLLAPPFNFPAPLQLIPDDEDAKDKSKAEKFLGLWKVGELPD